MRSSYGSKCLCRGREAEVASSRSLLKCAAEAIANWTVESESIFPRLNLDAEAGRRILFLSAGTFTDLADAEERSECADIGLVNFFVSLLVL